MSEELKVNLFEDLTPNREAAWLLSFSDLSTLLLCFFVSLLTNSPLNPSFHPGNYNISTQAGEDLYPASPAFEPAFDHGTPFAKLYAGSTQTEFILKRSHFGETFEFSAEARRQALSAMDLGSYDLEAVSLESCFAGEAASDETRWFNAMTQALSTRSQLIDAGVDPARVTVRILGPWCAALNRQEPAENLAGILRFKMRRKGEV